MKQMKNKMLALISLCIVVCGITLTLAFRDQKVEQSGDSNSTTAFDRDTTYSPLLDSFFYYFSQKDKLKGFDYLFSTNKYFKLQPEKMDLIKSNLSKLLPQLGEYYGFDHITEKRVGNRYILKSYVLLFERQPLRLNILFYKPDDKWFLDQIMYDADLSAELKMAGNIYSLPENMIIINQKY